MLNVPSDDWLLIVPTDAYDYGMAELRRSPRYRTALWFERLCWALVLPAFVVLVTNHATAVILAVAIVLAVPGIVLRHRAGVPVVRPSKWNAPARYRWRQFNRDVCWLPRR